MKIPTKARKQIPKPTSVAYRSYTMPVVIEDELNKLKSLIYVAYFY